MRWAPWDCLRNTFSMSMVWVVVGTVGTCRQWSRGLCCVLRMLNRVWVRVWERRGRTTAIDHRRNCHGAVAQRLQRGHSRRCQHLGQPSLMPPSVEQQWACRVAECVGVHLTDSKGRGHRDGVVSC